MRKGLEQAFDECLARMRRGESLESCLEQYPQDREELGSLLRLAGALIDNYRASAPTAQTLTRGRAAFLGEAVQLQAKAEQAGWLERFRQALHASRASRALGSLALTLVFLVAALAGGSMVSANSLPGDALYGVKRASEQVRYMLTLDEENRAALQETYQALRRQEIVSLLEHQRVTQVAFSGVVESLRGDTVTISGIAIQLAGDMVRNRPEIGAEVDVVAETQADGTISAQDVLVVAAAPPTPTPIVPTPTATSIAPTEMPPAQVVPTSLPSQTAIPTQMPKPTATDTSVPTDTPQATATSDATLEASVTPSASSTATEAPTATPWPTFTMPAPPQEVTVRIEGSIDEIEDDFWRVSGERIKIISSTSIKQEAALAQVGGWAVVRAVKRTDNSLEAQEIEVIRGPEAPPEPVEFSGVIESLSESQWLVSGKTVVITEETEINGSPEIGRQALVKAKRLSDGQLVADQISVIVELERVQFEGLVQSIASDRWVVAGQEVLIDGSTQIEGEAMVGAIAEVQAVLQQDGSKLAELITIIWTPEPTATSMPTDEPTATAEPTPEPTATTEPTVIPEATASTEPTATVEPALDPTASPGEEQPMPIEPKTLAGAASTTVRGSTAER